jgi:hypothetical protein
VWILWRPDRIFTLLGLEQAPKDAVVWQGLGVLALVNALLLAAAFCRPRAWGLAVLVPLAGRLQAIGTWLWLMQADVPQRASQTLWLLLAHEALWLPAFAWFLIAWWCWYRRDQREQASAASSGKGVPGPAILRSTDDPPTEITIRPGG